MQQPDLHSFAQQTATEIVETVSSADLVKSWQSDFGIDVAHLFEDVPEIALLKDNKTGRLSFYPAVEGDPAFYQALRAFDWYHPPSKDEFAAAASYHRPGELIIDVGAGAGGFAAHVPRPLYRGLETDSEAVKAAHAKGLNLVHSDMAEHLASEYFQPAGLVTAFQVLEHVRDPDMFLHELVALADKGGRVVVGVPDAGSYVADLPDFMLNAPPHHLTWWTGTALRDSLQTAGLRILETHRFKVEPWERQLWWMSKLARLARPEKMSRLGAKLRTRKVASYLGSWALQKCPIPKTARGSTLLMVAEKVG